MQKLKGILITIILLLLLLNRYAMSNDEFIEHITIMMLRPLLNPHFDSLYSAYKESGDYSVFINHLTSDPHCTIFEENNSTYFLVGKYMAKFTCNKLAGVYISKTVADFEYCEKLCRDAIMKK